MMIPDRPPEKVTIEDLLRLKRAERPSPEFWTRFEQDLRAKQLAAIVERRPWWHALHLPQTARAIARFQAPVGAAAVLALSFVVVSHYRPDPAPIGQPLVVAPAPTPVTAVVAPMAPKADAFAAALTASVPLPKIPAVTSVSTPEPAGVPVRTEIAVNTAALPSQPVELTSMIPWGVGQTQDSTASGQSPVSTRLLETGLQAASMPNLPVTSLLANVRPDESRMQPLRSQVAEVKPAVGQAVSPRELRRAKILAGLVLADNAEGPDYARVMHGRDIAANDLSEAQLYDSARRLGVGGDRFTLKF